jgi:hypothetical protein
MTNPPKLHSDLLPDDRAFDRIKADLLAQIDAENNSPAPQPTPAALITTAKSSRGQRRRWVTAMATAAAAVGITLLASTLVGPNASTAEAAAVLRTAAAATIVSADPVVGPGEYLAITDTEVALRWGEDYAYEYTQQMVVYIPADRTGTWVESRQAMPPGAIYGNAARAQSEIESGAGAQDPDEDDAIQLYEGTGGLFPTMTEADIHSVPDLPDDAARVLDYFYENRTGQNPADEQVFTDITDLLGTGLVPAHDRALLFDALARVPGVYLSDGAINLDGRSGVAISRDMDNGRLTDQLIIDADTGLLIGKRSVQNTAEAFVPAGAVVYLTAIETEVVAEAPSGPYLLPAPPG